MAADPRGGDRDTGGTGSSDQPLSISAEQDGELAEQVERVVNLLHRLETLYTESSERHSQPAESSEPAHGMMPGDDGTQALFERFAPGRGGVGVPPERGYPPPPHQVMTPPPLPATMPPEADPAFWYKGPLSEQPHAPPRRRMSTAIALGFAAGLIVVLAAASIVAGVNGVSWRDALAKIAPEGERSGSQQAPRTAEVRSIPPTPADSERTVAAAPGDAPPPPPAVPPAPQAVAPAPSAAPPTPAAAAPPASPPAPAPAAEPAQPPPTQTAAAHLPPPAAAPPGSAPQPQANASPAAQDAAAALDPENAGEGDSDESPAAATEAPRAAVPAAQPPRTEPAPPRTPDATARGTAVAGLDATPPAGPLAGLDPSRPEAGPGAPPVKADAASTACNIIMGESDQSTVAVDVNDPALAGRTITLKVDDLDYNATFDADGSLNFRAPRLDATTVLRWVSGDGSLCQKTVPAVTPLPLMQIALVWGGDLQLELNVIEPQSWLGNPVGHISPLQPNADGEHGLGKMHIFGRAGDATRAEVYTVSPDKISNDGLLNLLVRLVARPEGGGTCGSSAEVFLKDSVPYDVVIVRDDRPTGAYRREVKSFAFSLPPCNAVANQQRAERFSVRFSAP